MTEGLWTIDSNVLVYATEVGAPAPKRAMVQGLVKRLLQSSQACLAGQVLSEFMNVAVRKGGMPPLCAQESVRLMTRAAQVLGASPQAYEQAWALAASHRHQLWDALIVAVCADHGIQTLYSEDLGSLTRPLGVQVLNPFLDLEPT